MRAALNEKNISESRTIHYRLRFNSAYTDYLSLFSAIEWYLMENLGRIIVNIIVNVIRD